MLKRQEWHIKPTKPRKRCSPKSTTIIVGKTRVPDKKTGKPCTCKYSDVPTDEEGWVIDLAYFPIYFDVVAVLISGKPKPISAWFDGSLWQGLRLREGNVVKAWKRNPYDGY